MLWEEQKREERGREEKEKGRRGKERGKDRERGKERGEREGEDGKGEGKRLLQRKNSHLGTKIMQYPWETITKLLGTTDTMII